MVHTEMDSVDEVGLGVSLVVEVEDTQDVGDRRMSHDDRALGDVEDPLVRLGTEDVLSRNREEDLVVDEAGDLGVVDLLEIGHGTDLVGALAEHSVERNGSG